MAEPAIVGTEVVAPVRDAVRLVTDERERAALHRVEHSLAKARVRQPLRRDQQEVDLVGSDPRFGLGPGIDVRRIDRDGGQVEPLRGCDLISHESEERRDHDRGSPSPVAQHARRREVDGRLAETGARNQQRPPTLRGDCRDRLDLLWTGNGVRTGKRLDVSGQLRLNLRSRRTRRFKDGRHGLLDRIDALRGGALPIQTRPSSKAG